MPLPALSSACEDTWSLWHLFGQYNFIPAVHIRFLLRLVGRCRKEGIALWWTETMTFHSFRSKQHYENLKLQNQSTKSDLHLLQGRHDPQIEPEPYILTLLSQYFLRLLVMSAPVSSSERDSNTICSEAARICNAQKDCEVFGLCSTQKLKVLQILPPLLYRVKHQAVSVQRRQKYLHSPFLKLSLFHKGYLYILILQHGERLEEAFF